MTSILITNIKQLIQTEETPKLKVVGKQMAELPTIRDAWLFIDAGIIAGFGSMSSFDRNLLVEQTTDMFEIDAFGKMVFPSFVDSHTHLVYPASREIEYIDKIKGLSYEEIAARGGGILNTARRLKDISEEALLEASLARLKEITRYGTGAVEIKSGYGLDLEGELKMLRVIRKLKEMSPLTIKATFLGAHSIPLEYRGKQDQYVDLVINEMLPQVAEEQLADYVDVFCDTGFFTVRDTEHILEAGLKYG
ncbi:MAG: imidazolonepropionase, partial [Bacteroidetes bacterium CG_4_10_14_3_um_filter_42_6]